MQRDRASTILSSLGPRQLVQIHRRFEEAPVQGYVLGVGPSFFLIALVNDRLWHDGFECLRLTDLVSVEPHLYAEFVERALYLRGLRRPKLPKVSLGSIEEILRTAGTKFPLVSIQCEAKYPDACYIGRVLATNRTQVTMLEIEPDATWDLEPRVHSLRSITRVSFGGDYESALFLVAGSGAA